MDGCNRPDRPLAGHNEIAAQHHSDIDDEPSHSHHYDCDVHRLSDRSCSHRNDVFFSDTDMVTLTKNEHPEFKGVATIYREQREQLQKFCGWAAAHDWNAFHGNHYDWWTFPIDQPSSFGFGYTVFEAERSELAAMPEFTASLEEAARLLLLSWGWDATLNRPLPNPEPQQKWADWPIRWSKCTRSLELFGLNEMHDSCLQYGKWLLDRGVSFEYRGRDLAVDHGLRD